MGPTVQIERLTNVTKSTKFKQAKKLVLPKKSQSNTMVLSWSYNTSTLLPKLKPTGGKQAIWNHTRY